MNRSREADGPALHVATILPAASAPDEPDPKPPVYGGEPRRCRFCGRTTRWPCREPAERDICGRLMDAAERVEARHRTDGPDV